MTDRPIQRQLCEYGLRLLPCVCAVCDIALSQRGPRQWRWLMPFRNSSCLILPRRFCVHRYLVPPVETQCFFLRFGRVRWDVRFSVLGWGCHG